MKIDYSTDYKKCFVCGKENKKGLRLDFVYDRDSGLTSTEIVFKSYMQGYEGLIHGGFISMLLDEVMAKACLNAGYIAVTGRLSVKFIKPVFPNEKMLFYGRINDIKRNVVKASAWCENDKFTKKAEAESTFIILSEVNRFE